MDPTQILTDNGLENAADIVRAAEAAGLPLYVAAAVIEKESGGRNVYGNDHLGVYSDTDPAGYTRPMLGVVNAENYATFERRVLEEKAVSNGVGPAQVTYPGFILDARDRGIPLWVPYDNMLYGFRLLAGYMAATGGNIPEVGTLYNKGNLLDGVNAYGEDLIQRAARWHELLTGEPMPKRQPTQAEMTQIAAVLAEWGLELYCDPSDWKSGACRPGNHSHSSDSRHFLGRAVDFGWGAAPISDTENLVVLVAIRMLDKRFPQLAIRKLFNVGPGNHEDHGHADDMGLGTGGWASTVRDPKNVLARDGVDLFVPAGLFQGKHVPPINHGLTMAHVAKFQTAAAKLGLYTGRSDGYHGKGATSAALAVQKAAGLFPDGKAGPNTLAAALDMVAKAQDPYAAFTEAYIREVQVMLKALGYYTGGIDGEPGKLFQSAVERFQIKHRLEPVDKLPGKETRAAIVKAHATMLENQLKPTAPAPAPTPAPATPRPKPVPTVPTRRIAGANRYATAAAISRERFPNGAVTAYLAVTQTDDAALGAGFQDGPVLLVPKGATRLPLDTINELRRLNPKNVVALGGESGVTEAARNHAAQVAAE